MQIESLSLQRQPDSTGDVPPLLHPPMIALPIPALAAILIPTIAVADISSLARVIDGDTIEIQDQQIRILGIDAPERSQT